ncbi:hypothetical protein G5C51_26820 [Streptomyces sp. A7024]|uniref:Uncharacterized protein n=1 Tax=Streptomyces coryli TaxID=1128680 RepID=A0A6G4U5J4_9ACTN|nr:hypothetical protein [Streptomyces coryli]NGN67505.1 hypothetical protein [Streptomyces coryli]
MERQQPWSESVLEQARVLREQGESLRECRQALPRGSESGTYARDLEGELAAQAERCDAAAASLETAGEALAAHEAVLRERRRR